MRDVVAMQFWTVNLPTEVDLQPILLQGVEIVVAVLKKEMSVGVDNVTAELVQASDVLIEIVTRSSKQENGMPH